MTVWSESLNCMITVWLMKTENVVIIDEKNIHNFAYSFKQTIKKSSCCVTYNLSASFLDRLILPLLLCTPILPVLDQLNYVVPLAIDRLLSDQPYLFLFFIYLFLILFWKKKKKHFSYFSYITAITCFLICFLSIFFFFYYINYFFLASHIH